MIDVFSCNPNHIDRWSHTNQTLLFLLKFLFFFSNWFTVILILIINLNFTNYFETAAVI